MSFPKSMYIVLNVSHILTLFPLNVTLINQQIDFKVNKKLYIFKVFILDCVVFSCITTFALQIQNNRISLNEIVFMCCSFPIILAILEIQVMGYCCKNKFAEILTTLHKIGSLLPQDKAFGKCLTIPLLLMFFSFVYLSSVYFIFYDFSTALIINLGYTISKFMLLASSCIVVIFLKLTKYFFEKLKNELLYHRNLIFLFQTYFELVFICKKLNKLFGRQLLITIFIFLIWTVYEMYHLLILLTWNSSPKFLICLALSYTIIQQLTLFLILHTCQAVKHEAQLFKAHWYSILLRKQEICLKNTKINRFSIRLTYENFEFTPFGLYTLNNNHFFSVSHQVLKLFSGIARLRD